MQTANALLALGANRDHVVQKYGLTPAEVQVLNTLHGSDDAVFDIEVLGSVERTSREERQRLLREYERHESGRKQAPEVNMLYPGVAAALPVSFSDLGLPEDVFKAVRRAVPEPEQEVAAKRARRPAEPVAGEAPEVGKNVFS